eukprot:scaffold6198_cov107-Isochrysis_galbana.AAC.3
MESLEGRCFASPSLATRPAACAKLDFPLAPHPSQAVAPRVYGHAETGRSACHAGRPVSAHQELGQDAEHALPVRRPCLHRRPYSPPSLILRPRQVSTRRSRRLHRLSASRRLGGRCCRGAARGLQSRRVGVVTEVLS